MQTNDSPHMVEQKPVHHDIPTAAATSTSTVADSTNTAGIRGTTSRSTQSAESAADTIMASPDRIEKNRLPDRARPERLIRPQHLIRIVLDDKEIAEISEEQVERVKTSKSLLLYLVMMVSLL